MTNQPPSSPSKINQGATQLLKTIQFNITKTALKLKPNARVPEIRVQDAGMDKPEVYPLLGDRYVLGRSSKSCDIVIRNPVVSQIHCSLERDQENSRFFIIKDEGSTNGVFLKKKRLKNLHLRHGDQVTLGPPELSAAVTIKYYNPPPLWVQLIRSGLYTISFLTGLTVIFLAIAWSQITVSPIPDGMITPVVVYADDNQTTLNPYRAGAHQELDKISEFSPYLPQAVIASEDTRFYWHFGVDPMGIARAILVNIQEQELAQGASTITQQLARSLFPEVGRQNTAGRKLREMLVALKLEAVYSKNDLLKLYLNRVFLGFDNYGFQDAARFYFDKSASI